jgi:hypothetical protein
MTIRRKFICDTVEYYKRNNADEYSKFLEYLDWRRDQLQDTKMAKVKGATEMRLAACLPDKLMNQIRYALNGVNEEMFLEAKGEMKWFCKKYQEFLIPNQW